MANSFLDLAIEVLKQASKPLTYQEVWELVKQLGITPKIKTTGKNSVTSITWTTPKLFGMRWIRLFQTTARGRNGFG
jgi:hypothetical protein